MTLPDIDPSDLVRLAGRMRAIDSDVSPQLVNRRAISTAYYAVFHQLTREIAREGVGDPASPAGHALVRWLSHSDLRQLAEAVTGVGGKRTAIGQVLEPSEGLRALAAVFIQLQDGRHDADYNHDFECTAADVFQAIQGANKVILDSVVMRTRDPSYRVFLKLALGAIRIAKSR